MTDWGFLDSRVAQRAVEDYARDNAQRFGSYDDAYRESAAYLAQHPEIFEGKVTRRILYQRLIRGLRDIEVKEETDESSKDDGPSMILPDHMLSFIEIGTYTFEKVASLVWACEGLDDIESMSDPHKINVTPEVKVHVYSDPSHANDRWAEIADVRSALALDNRVNRAGLSTDEMEHMLNYYADDRSSDGINITAAQMGVIKIVNYLNK